MFISYCTDKKTYKLFDPNSHTFFASRDVVFHENVGKGDQMNNTGVWDTSNENDNPVKIDANVKH